MLCRALRFLVCCAFFNICVFDCVCLVLALRVLSVLLIWFCVYCVVEAVVSDLRITGVVVDVFLCVCCFSVFMLRCCFIVSVLLFVVVFVICF